MIMLNRHQILFYLLCKWFNADHLVQTMGKPNIVKFTATILPHYPLAVECAGKFIKGTRTVRPLGTQTDNHLNWKSHTHQILPKLSAACFKNRRSSDGSFHIRSFCVYAWNNMGGKLLI